MKLIKKTMNCSMIILLCMIMLGSTVMAGCSNTEKNTDEDFEISLYWDTGSLPPQYHYYYLIRLDSRLNGFFEYQPGYGEPPAPEVWKQEFQIRDRDLAILLSLLDKNNIFRRKWAKTDPSVGGSYNYLVIKKGTAVYKIPPDFELKKGDSAKVEEISDFMRSLVPEETWETIRQKQMEFEKEYEKLYSDE